MKKFTLLFSTLLVLLLITACGDDSNNNTTPVEPADEPGMETEIDSKDAEEEAEDEEAETDAGEEDSIALDQAENEADMKKMMEELDFREFDLEVEYADDKEFDVEIDYDSDGSIEAEVDDEINGVHIEDDLEAFNHLYPYVNQLDIQKEMDKQEVINQLLDVFSLNDDYVEFKVEFEFHDNTELKIEDKR
ncbi:MAG TPA: YusW family protein [Pseudogracilibacillus sp.]|nr:YusW family protein [Pseudogracilibacillus sp.]